MCPTLKGGASEAKAGALSGSPGWVAGSGWAGEGPGPRAPGRRKQSVVEVPWPKLAWLDLPLRDLLAPPFEPGSLKPVVLWLECSREAFEPWLWWGCLPVPPLPGQVVFSPPGTFARDWLLEQPHSGTDRDEGCAALALEAGKVGSV